MHCSAAHARITMMQMQLNARLRHIEFGIKAGRPAISCLCIHHTKVGTRAAAMQRRKMLTGSLMASRLPVMALYGARKYTSAIHLSCTNLGKGGPGLTRERRRRPRDRCWRLRGPSNLHCGRTCFATAARVSYPGVASTYLRSRAVSPAQRGCKMQSATRAASPRIVRPQSALPTIPAAVPTQDRRMQYFSSCRWGRCR